MVRKSANYSRTPEEEGQSCRARASQLRTHFKKMHEVGAFIKNMTIQDAIDYLLQVIDRKRAIPFKHFRAGCGRHAQGKCIKAPGSQVGWPVKSCKFMIDILTNLKANAESKGLELDNLVLTHVQVNQAPVMRRRTYRAHGRINPYMCHPCHVELFAEYRREKVPKEKEEARQKTRKQLAMQRLGSGAIVAVGGGV